VGSQQRRPHSSHPDDHCAGKLLLENDKCFILFIYFRLQGRYDVVCPAKSAYDLKVKFPEAVLNVGCFWDLFLFLFLNA
jgi:hypothetical protein